MFSGLGGKPSAEKAGTNVFGTAQTFGSPSQEGCKFYNNSFKYFGTFRSEQTVQTQIRLLQKEQSDQDLHCFAFDLLP